MVRDPLARLRTGRRKEVVDETGTTPSDPLGCVRTQDPRPRALCGVDSQDWTPKKESLRFPESLGRLHLRDSLFQIRRNLRMTFVFMGLVGPSTQGGAGCVWGLGPRTEVSGVGDVPVKYTYSSTVGGVRVGYGRPGLVRRPPGGPVTRHRPCGVSGCSIGVTFLMERGPRIIHEEKQVIYLLPTRSGG